MVVEVVMVLIVVTVIMMVVVIMKLMSETFVGMTTKICFCSTGIDIIFKHLFYVYLLLCNLTLLLLLSIFIYFW